jgi:hypothetical protein
MSENNNQEQTIDFSYEKHTRYMVGLSHLWITLTSKILLDIIDRNDISIDENDKICLEQILKNMPDMNTMDILKRKADEEIKYNNTIIKAIQHPETVSTSSVSFDGTQIKYN